MGGSAFPKAGSSAGEGDRRNKIGAIYSLVSFGKAMPSIREVRGVRALEAAATPVS